MKHKHVLFLSEHDPTGLKDWSGSPYFMYQHLKPLWERFTAVQIPFDKKRPVPLTLAESGQIASEAVRQHQPDLVICQGNSMVPELVADCPVICWHDSCWRLLAGLPVDEFRAQYPDLQDWDRRFLERADHVFMASEWAMNYTQLYYRPFRNKISLLTFGPNFLSVPSDQQIEAWRQQKITRSECRLVFIGVDVMRKGLSTAIDLQQMLLKQGIDARLDLIGGIPAFDISDYLGIQIQGFFDKENPEQHNRLQELIGQADFLVHPAYRECFGCVLVEANRLGVPALSTPTDGIPTIIKAGYNGFLAPHDSFAASMTQEVTQLLAHRQTYVEISRQAEVRARDVLSWDRSARQLKAFCDQL